MSIDFKYVDERSSETQIHGNDPRTSSQSAHLLFAQLYRIHALSGELLCTIERASGEDKHAVTSAIVNLIDTWLCAIGALERADSASIPLFELQAVRLAMFNASAVMIRKLNHALWTRAAPVLLNPYNKNRRNSTWRNRAVEKKELIVDFVRRNPGLSIDEIGVQLGITPYTVNRHLLALESEDRIHVERRGKRHRKFFIPGSEQAAIGTAASEIQRQVHREPDQQCV